MTQPLLSPELPDRRLSRLTQLERLTTTFGEAVDTAGARGFDFTPGASIFRFGELALAQDPQNRGGIGRLANREPSPRLSEDDWRASEHFRDKLDYPEGGYTEDAARIMAERFDRRARQDFVLSRAPTGIGTQAALFGAEIGANLIDPLSIAASFVPVVGQVRFAQMATRFGMTRARALRGGIEGFAGNLALEPIVLGVARQEQADYTMTDSLVNLAFGTAFSSGLHLGGGAVADLMRRRGAPAREMALRKAVGDLSEDLPVDVDGAARMDPGAVARVLEARSRQELDTAAGDLARAAPVTDIFAVIREMGGIRPEGELADLDLARARPGLVRRGGRSVADIRERFEEVGILPPRSADTEVFEIIADQLRGRERVEAADIDASVARGEAGERLRQAEQVAAARDELAREVRLRGARDVSPEDVEDLVRRSFAEDRDPIDLLDEVLERRALEQDGGQAAPESGGDIPFGSADQPPSHRVANDPDQAAADVVARGLDEPAELDPAMIDADIEALRASGRLSADDLAELDVAAKAAAEAEDLGQAYQMAAVCMGRQG